MTEGELALWLLDDQTDNCIFNLLIFIFLFFFYMLDIVISPLKYTWNNFPTPLAFENGRFLHAALCCLSDDIYDYYYVSQGKITVASIDDKEEMEFTDVRFYRKFVGNPSPQLFPSHLMQIWFFQVIRNEILTMKNILIIRRYIIIYIKNLYLLIRFTLSK